MKESRMIAIEKQAEKVRKDCQISGCGVSNIFECVQRLEYRVIRYPFKQDTFLGLAMIKEGERIVISNSSQILAREIFTIAHETGHHILHIEENGLNIIQDNCNTEKNNLEIEADYFAACFLMPAEKVRSYIRLELQNKPPQSWSGLEIAKIMTAFNVSYDTVLNRLEFLKIIDENLRARLFDEKIQNTVTKLLNIINGNSDLCKKSEVTKIPAQFIEWVVNNYKNKLIPYGSLENALSKVGLKPEDFQIEKDFENDEDSLDEG